MTIEVQVRASAEASVEQAGDSARVHLGTDANRGAPRFVAELARPDVVRDALTVLARVYESDLRFAASDRSDYLAFLLKQGKKATKELWEAQKAFLDERFGEATGEESPLEPIVTISEDELSFEVLSADESAYARLSFRAGEAYEALEIEPGTTHIRVGPNTKGAIASLRGYRATTLDLGASEADTEARSLNVPERWLRALSQVQAASTLPADGFTLTPIDFYNILFTLRMRRAKKSPRALRYELVPGERPRVVFEPWDTMIESVGGTYEGGRPRIVRTWGRRRLSVLSPLLAHLREVRVYPMGAGLPVFYEHDLGQVRWLAYHRDVDRGTHYRRWTVPKRDGRRRLISEPKPLLKKAQRWITRAITEHLPVHGAAHGFLCGRSTVSNAAVHAGAGVVIKLDLSDFYPTITTARVKGMFRKAGYGEQVATLLAMLTTASPREEIVLRGQRYYVATAPRSLPQGAPSSPSITNAVCLRMDCRLSGLARKLGLR